MIYTASSSDVGILWQQQFDLGLLCKEQFDLGLHYVFLSGSTLLKAV